MKLFQRLADWASIWCGSPQFLGLHIAWWGIWIGVPVEKYPYNLLTMLLSLEAIVLMILLLNSDARQGEKDRKAVRKDLDVDKATHEMVSQIWKKLND